MKLAKRLFIITLALFFVLDSRFLCACQLFQAEDQSACGAPCQQVAGCHCDQDDQDAPRDEQQEDVPCRMLEPAILASSLVDSHDLAGDLESTITFAVWSSDCPMKSQLVAPFDFRGDGSTQYLPRPTYVLFGSFRS